MRYLSLILILTTIKSWAVITSPILQKACINFNDSIVTISWTEVTDACNSFVSYDLYGNENGGAYLKLATITNKAIVEYPHSISNINTNRKYYLITHSACGGLDSLTSDTISIDITYPNVTEIDSVSYDVNTQNIIAGWQSNPSTDTKGYQIYNFSSGNGDSIGFTKDTFYTVTKNPNNDFPVVLAPIDSCNLSAILSRPHQVMRLNSTFDTCKREISINWSLYQGWSKIDSQRLYLRTNNQNYNIDTTLSGTTTARQLKNIQLGDTFCFYIRAYTKSGAITSSSNISCVETRKLIKPSYLYLSNVTVKNNKDVEIEWVIDNERDQKLFNIYKSTNNSSFQLLKTTTTTKSTTYREVDNATDVHSKSYTYYVEVVNKCDETTKTSLKSNSILFKNNPNVTHTTYNNFDGGIKEYKLLRLSNNGSTWNTFYTSEFPILLDNLDSTGCYLVEAHEKLNSFNFNRISTSNTRCVYDSLVVDVPTGINTTGSNNRFVILGKGIDHSRSYYKIFNRWGELIAFNPTNTEWYPEYRNTKITTSVYIYVVQLYGVQGEKKTLKGTLYVVQ